MHDGGDEVQKYYWMAVTADKYELPLAVADSSFSLAMMLGIHQGTVLACEAKRRSGRNSGRKIIKIKVEPEIA